MRITVHDGFDTIGGNKISVCSRSGECALLDFGLNFKRWGEFFEEFLNPRTGRVVQDLLRLDLIPSIPVYRKDLTKEFSHNGKYRFVFISHAHADHSGMIGLLDPSIPVLATPETLSIMDVDSELSARNAVWRRFRSKKRELVIGDDVVRGDLRRTVKGSKGELVRRVVRLGNLPPNVETVELESVWESVEVVPVYHSVLGSSAIVMNSDGWWIVYTGDLKMGPSNEEEEWWLENLGKRRLELSTKTRKFIEKVKDMHPMVLIIEGTRVTREESGEEITERDVYENSLSLIGSSNGLVLVDFPIRHLERLLTFLKVALETGRKLVLLPKEYAYLKNLQSLEPAWELSDDERRGLAVYHQGKLRFEPMEREIIKEAIEKGNLVEPEDINASPRDYILFCGYWSITTLLDLEEGVLRNSIYIHSTSESYTEEQQLDVIRFTNWLKRFSIEPHGIEFKGDSVKFTREFHASGHISAHDLRRLVDELKPEVILPVHTLDRRWFESIWGERVCRERILEIP